MTESFRSVNVRITAGRFDCLASCVWLKAAYSSQRCQQESRQVEEMREWASKAKTVTRECAAPQKVPDQHKPSLLTRNLFQHEAGKLFSITTFSNVADRVGYSLLPCKGSTSAMAVFMSELQGLAKDKGIVFFGLFMKRDESYL